MRRLVDLGERRLIDAVFRSRYSGSVANFGDDTALFGGLDGPGAVVGSTDPCPHPASSLIGRYSYSSHGHLLGTINLSDLAAAGAVPVGLLVSLELPQSLAVAELEEFLDGLDACCRASGTSVIGGNIRDSDQLRATGFALGKCDGPPMSRIGAQAGDSIVALGSLGLAWSRVLAERHGLVLGPEEVERAEAVLVNPMPKTAVGIRARVEGLLNACTDASDGVDPAIRSLAAGGGVQADVALDEVPYEGLVQRVAESLGIHPWSIARTWGDWCLVGSAASNSLERLEEVADEEGVEFACLGEFSTGTGVRGVSGGSSEPLAVLDSERFVRLDRPFLDWYADSVVTQPVVRSGGET